LLHEVEGHAAEDHDADDGEAAPRPGEGGQRAGAKERQHQRVGEAQEELDDGGPLPAGAEQVRAEAGEPPGRLGAAQPLGAAEARGERREGLAPEGRHGGANLARPCVRTFEVGRGGLAASERASNRAGDCCMVRFAAEGRRGWTVAIARWWWSWSWCRG